MITTDEESPGFSDYISAIAKRATSNAAADALASGRAIVYMEDNKIIKHYPNGHKEILKILDGSVDINENSTKCSRTN